MVEVFTLSSSTRIHLHSYLLENRETCLFVLVFVFVIKVNYINLLSVVSHKPLKAIETLTF